MPHSRCVRKVTPAQRAARYLVGEAHFPSKRLKRPAPAGPRMADFEMLSSERVEFNQGGEFLELSINVVKDGNRQTPYLRLARGFYGSDGEPRYKKGGCTLPIDRE